MRNGLSIKSATKHILCESIGINAKIELINPIKDTILKTGTIAIFVITEYKEKVLK